MNYSQNLKNILPYLPEQPKSCYDSSFHQFDNSQSRPHKWYRLSKQPSLIENPSLLCLLESRNKTVKLSNDHEIILGLAEVIVTGIKESKFLHRRIGPINLACFTTSEARVLRCYMSEIDPKEYLINMVRFLIFV